MSQTKQRRDLYQEVTDKIIAAIESGTAPWQRGWAELAELGLPMNGQSSRQYNGINSMLLFLTSQERGYSDNRFFTFKQVNELGAKVRKGEKSTPVYFFKMLQASEQEGIAAKGETPRMIPFLTEYRVFNAQQVEGIEPRNVPEREWTPIQAVEQVVERMKPRIEHGGNRAYYSPTEHYIRMPHQGSFPSAAEYSGTLLHELSHWTGGRLGTCGSHHRLHSESRQHALSCPNQQRSQERCHYLLPQFQSPKPVAEGE